MHTFKQKSYDYNMLHELAFSATVNSNLVSSRTDPYFRNEKKPHEVRRGNWCGWSNKAEAPNHRCSNGPVIKDNVPNRNSDRNETWYKPLNHNFEWDSKNPYQIGSWWKLYSRSKVIKRVFCLYHLNGKFFF